MQSNPNFANFMASHQGQSIQDVYKSYGYDLDEVLNLLNINS